MSRWQSNPVNNKPLHSTNHRGCTPVEVLTLLQFRDFNLVVRCLEVVCKHIADFAPECQSWEIQVIPLCHHHPNNIYPALGVYEAGTANIDDIERFGQKADEWVQKQPLGWLLEASAKVDAVTWDVLRGNSRAKSSDDAIAPPD
jgi:hypothetical protein